MFESTNPDPRLLTSAGDTPPPTHSPQPTTAERDRILHLIIGPYEGVNSTIQALHVLRYAEQFHWTDAIYIPPSGLLITPQQGEVMRCLMRHRLRGTPQS